MAEKTPPAKPPAASRGGDQLSRPRKGPPAAARARGTPAPPAGPIPYTEGAIAEIFRRFELQRPKTRTELEHVNAFTLLVAVVLSAQSTDAGVNKATRGLFAAADTPGKMAALGEDAVRGFIATVGFAPTKARNVVSLSRLLVERHGGAVPNDREALEALPGVGRKTASVVLNNAFGEKTLAVDTHIFRLGNRLKLAPGKTPEEVERGLLRIVPDPFLAQAHNWLLLHGRYVCKARRPECERCIVADLCRADVRTNDVPAPIVPIPLPAYPGVGPAG